MFEHLVVWGGLEGLESHRHIHRHFFNTARKLGMRPEWLQNKSENREKLTPGTTVITADVVGTQIGIAMPGVNYVIHNFDGLNPLCQTAEPHRILRLQVYTDDAAGEEWAPFRLYHREAQTLFQPWGTDLLAEEFDEPVFTPTSHDVVFVGAIWSDQWEGKELGNQGVIAELKHLCRENRLQFVHKTHVSDDENASVVRGARLAPAFAGAWQVEHNYLPCRVFKNISYGVLGVTNVPAAAGIISCPPGELWQQFNWAINIKRNDYVQFVREQQRAVANYTYRESLAAISRALSEQNAH